MNFGIIILLRVLFVTSMVFVIGYVFGPFSKNPTLTTLTKIAAVLAIVLFIATNVFFFRAAGRRFDGNGRYGCGYFQKDSTAQQQQLER